MPGWPPNALRRVSLAVSGALLVAACTSPSPAPQPPAPTAAAPAGLAPVTVRVPAGLDAAPLNTPRTVLVPPGWTMSVWARVPTARLATWSPEGALLVSVPAKGQVVRLMPKPVGTPETSVLLDGLDQPHGLAFAGSTLYVAQSDQVDAYTYADAHASAPKLVVGGLPDARSDDLGGAYAHALKSVAVGPDGAVYFSIGSTGNVSAQDRSADPPRATIMRVAPGGGPATVYATGVRNGTGLAIAPDGSVWTAVNNRDQVAYPQDGPSYGDVLGDYVNDHPPESVARLMQGRELGWPYCNPDVDEGPRFVRDVQTNADGSKMDCSQLPAVEQTLGAHSAPLGMSFVNGLPQPFGTGALVGVHGSWNRTPPRAPEVSFFAWRSGTLGPQQTLVAGFQNPDGSRWGRPVAAVAGPDGAVYITDDYAGAVYRLAPPGR